MIEKKEIPEQIDFLDATSMSYKKFYKELDDAIKKRNENIVYRLSKVITRYHLSH